VQNQERKEKYMSAADMICSAIDVNYADSEMTALFGPVLGPYIRDKLIQWRAEIAQNGGIMAPPSTSNFTNSQVVALDSMLNRLESRVRVLEHITYGG
jgi:hypothetical protein